MCQTVDNPDMSELLKKIQDAGIRTGGSAEDSLLTARPQYLGCRGFFHLASDSWELIFVKGVYKDNIRRISGEAPFEDKKLNELAQILADVERTLRTAVTVKVWCDTDAFYIFSAEETELPGQQNDMRNHRIPSPLTAVERSLGKGDFISDRHLFTKSPFAEIFPETLSPIAMSFASQMPEVFNPLFISCSIKTQSPSMKLLYGRLYMNMANAETIVPAFKQTADFFLLNYAQSVYKTLKKPSLGVPDDSDMRIEDTEISDSLKDIAATIDSIGRDDIFTPEFIELTALCVMTWEMVYLRLWKSFMAVYKTLGKDISETLEHIYKTRPDSVLNETIEIFHQRFDPAEKPVIAQSCELTYLTPEEMYKKLSAGRRLKINKAKYIERLNAAHKYLRMRDDLHKAVSSLTGKLREILLAAGREMADNGLFTDPADIFCLELKEIKNITDDEYFGNIPFTLNFRKWQNARFAAMCMPYNLYEKDVEKAETISSAQIEKSESEKTLPALALFHKDLKTENYACGLSFTLSEIYSLRGRDAVIAECASLFSYTAEYCAVSDTPLYTGARFAALLLNSAEISTSENNIKYTEKL